MTAAASGVGFGRRDEHAVHAIADRFRDATHARSHHGHAGGHGLQQRDPLRLAERGQDGQVEGLGQRHHIGLSTGKDHAPAGGGRKGEGLRAKRIGQGAVADDSKPGIGHGPGDLRPGGEEIPMSLLRLQPGDDTDDEGIGRDAERGANGGSLPGRPMGAESIEVHAVGNDRDLGRSAALAAQLGGDGLRRGDQVVNERGRGRQGGNVVRGADPARVDRGDHRGRAGQAGGAGTEELGAEHVGVEEIHLALAQVRGEGSDREAVIRLVEDGDRQVETAHALDGGSIGQGDGFDREPGSVEAEHQVRDAALCPAHLSGGQQLDDPVP